MAGDDKKNKAVPASKAGAAAPKKIDIPKVDAPKAESGETAAVPKSYSRGEGQKPVSQAYKDNWNAIFGKKTTKKKKH